MHPSAFDDAGMFVSKYLDKNLKLNVADVGSYDVNGTLKPHFAHEGWKYTGFDISAGPNVDIVVPSLYGWAWTSGHVGQFDVVVTTQVMEHVAMPWVWIKDVAALCRPGGLVYVCTPNTIGYHAYPIDCWRAWPDGLRALMEYAGLHVIECYAQGVDTTGIASPCP